MGNMSYCRFQNTVTDIEECIDHMADSDLSEDENEARKMLIEICQQIIDDYKE